MTPDERAALAANDAFYAAFAGRDLAAMDALWAQALAVTCIHPGWHVLVGREAVLASWRAILANPDQPRIVSGGADARQIGEAVLVVCRELVAGNPLVATNVFVREEGIWKLAHHHGGAVAGFGG